MNSRRRQLVIALGAGALAPLAGYAQQPAGKVWRIGILASVSQAVAQGADRYGAFILGLRELGYVEGRNIAIEWRCADGVYDRLPGLATELANKKVDVIVTNSTPGASAAQRTTTTIPIVAISIGNPVGSGFAASLAHPGGNLTGLSTMGEDVYGKRLELLSIAVPKATRIAVLMNPNNISFMQSMFPALNEAAKKLNRKMQIVKASTISEFQEAFAQMAREHAGALLIQEDQLFLAHNSQIAELALRQKLPSIAPSRQYVEAGGLMSYGRDIAENFRRAATYVDKIFKGAKPGDLPIEQPSKLELVFNMKTAKALGIKIPDDLLLRADKVIE